MLNGIKTTHRGSTGIKKTSTGNPGVPVLGLELPINLIFPLNIIEFIKKKKKFSKKYSDMVILD